MFLATVMMLGLAGCNNNPDTAMQDVNINRDTAYRNVNDYKTNTYGTHTNINGPLNVRNNGYMDRNNTFYNRAGNNVQDNQSISNIKTTLTSSQYPHTKAVLIQDAKYKFIRIDPRQAVRFQERAFQVPTNQQRQIAQAPAQQQPAQQQQQQQPAQQQPAQQQPAQQQTQAQAKTPANISQIAQQVIDLTNAERQRNGLPALKADAQLSGVAQKKSTDMQQNNYFSHTSPTYGSPFDMMRDFGVTYKTAGENIAQGQQTPQQVVQAWMNSEGHRKNILSRDFTHIGVGYEKNGNHWTQMFIGK